MDKLKEEFYEKFEVIQYDEKVGWLTSGKVVSSKKMWNWIEKAIKSAKEEENKKMESLGDASTYLSAYGNPKNESLWVKISEVRLKINELKSKELKTK